MIIVKPADVDELSENTTWLESINKVNQLAKNNISSLKQELKNSVIKSQSEIVSAVKATSTEF